MEGGMAGLTRKKSKEVSENEDQLKLVTFQLGTELYGVEIMEVDQIVRIQDVRPIPNAPYYVEGIFTLRSEIIPIISLHKRFHIQKAVFEDEDESLGGFVILKIEGNKMGIVIDRIARVVDVKKEDIHWIRTDLALSLHQSIEAMVRIRYRQPLQKATLYLNDSGLYIDFITPQSAITSGQFAAWYIEDELIGSGEIY